MVKFLKGALQKHDYDGFVIELPDEICLDKELLEAVKTAHSKGLPPIVQIGYQEGYHSIISSYCATVVGTKDPKKNIYRDAVIGLIEIMTSPSLMSLVEK